MSLSWPWLLLAGLGMYHGLNPAMGWLFAVALGLHRGSRAVVLQSMVPIALGHMASIALVAATAVIAWLVYDWLGLDFLRRGWFNLDRIWTAALVVTGLFLMVPLPFAL